MEVINRVQMLDLIPIQGKECVEVGVYKGDFSAEILKRNPKSLHLIDPWVNYPEMPKVSDEDFEGIYQGVIERFRSAKNVIIHRSPSIHVAADCPEDRVDFVYIDGHHDYEPCLRDMRAWYPKIRDGGWLCGHDYNFPGGATKAAVTQFCREAGVDLEFVTTSERYSNSWGLRRKKRMVSIIMTCKGRRHHLEQSLKYVLRQAYKPLEVAVVNYDSDPIDNLSECLSEMNDSRIVHIRTGPREEFSRSKAKNIGIRASSGDILVFVDADVIITHEHFINDVEKLMMPGRFLKFGGGLTACLKSEVEEISGFNEAMSGWGEEDRDLNRRLRKNGSEQISYKHLHHKYIAHTDAERMTFHNNKDSHETGSLNIAISKKMIDERGPRIQDEWGTEEYEVIRYG